MSISNTQLWSVLDSLPYSPTETSSSSTGSASAASGPSVAANTSDTTDSSSTSSQQQSLNKDLVALLSDLVYGNVTGAKSELAKVQSDLKAEQKAASSTPDPSDSQSQSQPSLSTLLTTISNSLTSGNTESSLQALASFLVQNGQVSGNLVNTTA
jgi:hypothetical protein